MKTLPALLLLTAAVAAAPAAAEPVALSGDGWMGAHYDGDEWNFTSRLRVSFALSGETDGGLAFGGRFRADSAQGAARGSAGEVFVAGPFGRLSMGDVDGAAEMAVGNISAVGFTGLGDTQDTFFYSDVAATDWNPKFLYALDRGRFALFLSANDGAGSTVGAGVGVHPPATYSTRALGVVYRGRAWGETVRIGLGYEHVEDVTTGDQFDSVMVGAEFTVQNATVRGIYGSERGFAGSDRIQYGASMDYAFTPRFSITMFSRKNDYAGMKADHWYGLGAAYDLGGGAVIRGGVMLERIPGRESYVGDLGITFAF